jgi:hypothetical protein
MWTDAASAPKLSVTFDARIAISTTVASATVLDESKGEPF